MAKPLKAARELALSPTALPSFKLVVFDCDGTLVDSQHAITACMDHAFSAVKRVAPPLGHVRRVIGLPLAEAIAVLAEDENAPIDQMVAAYSTAWQRIRHDRDMEEPLFDGVLDILDMLDDAGCLMGVATGKSMRGLEATLKKHGIGDRFVTLQTADIARGKPDPDMLLRAMNETGAAPDETIMIGDTTFDILMARAANVRSYGVSWGYHEPEELRRAGAHAVLDNMAEIGPIIRTTKEIAT